VPGSLETFIHKVMLILWIDEMLSLLRQPGQQDRDTVMILHMGGTFGDKLATLERFKANYRNLSSSIKQRFVLENDDVAWSVHDLLPICEELNIPLCLDFHHHNIIFDSSQVREGTLDVKKVYHRIKATWDRKNIRQKMHYSEPCPEAITGRQRRKHNPRPITLPPCPNDMDLMIEAKDKEQAIFELMRTFKLPGFDTFNNIIPYERNDDNRPLPRRIKKKKTRKEIIAEIEEFGKELSEEEEETKPLIPDEEVGMGGAENRVYWPFGMEEWLRPKKREIKKKSGHEENDDTICKDPTFEDLALGKAIHTYEGEYLSDQMKERLGEANYLVDILKLLEEIKVARGANLVEEIWEDSSDKLAKKAFTPNAALAMSGTASGANGEAPKDLRRGGLPASGRISSQVSKSSTSRRQSSRAKAQNSYIKASGED
jgi:UV DNA damage endonuclease